MLKLSPVPHPAVVIANLLTEPVKDIEHPLAEVPLSHAEEVSEHSPPNSLDLPPKSVPNRSLSQTSKPSPTKLRFPRPAPKPKSKIKDAVFPRDPSLSRVESKSLKRVRTPAKVPNPPPTAVRKLPNLSKLSPSRATPVPQLHFLPPRVMSTTTNLNAMATLTNKLDVDAAE